MGVKKTSLDAAIEASECFGQALRQLKAVMRRALFRSLGVDKLVRKAFDEGWQMHGDTDITRDEMVACVMSPEQVDRLIERTRCWRSLDEAWANSDVEELV